MILTNYDGLESGFILTEYEAPPIGSYEEEVENVKICFWRHNNNQCRERHQYLGGTTQAYEKHLHYIISFISAVLKLLETTQTTDDGRQTTDNARGIA